MFYRLLVVDPLDTEAETEVERLFTADEIEQIRERYYRVDQLTNILAARPACNDCSDCDRGDICNK